MSLWRKLKFFILNEKQQNGGHLNFFTFFLQLKLFKNMVKYE